MKHLFYHEKQPCISKTSQEAGRRPDLLLNPAGFENGKGLEGLQQMSSEKTRVGTREGTQTLFGSLGLRQPSPDSHGGPRTAFPSAVSALTLPRRDDGRQGFDSPLRKRQEGNFIDFFAQWLIFQVEVEGVVG